MEPSSHAACQEEQQLQLSEQQRLIAATLFFCTLDALRVMRSDIASELRSSPRAEPAALVAALCQQTHGMTPLDAALAAILRLPGMLPARCAAAARCAWLHGPLPTLKPEGLTVGGRLMHATSVPSAEVRCVWRCMNACTHAR